MSLRGGHFRKPVVKGEESYVQAPSKSQIGGIVGGQLVAQAPYRVRELYDRIGQHTQIAKRSKSLVGSAPVQLSSNRITTQNREYLDVEMLGHVQLWLWREGGANCARQRPCQQQLRYSACVRDDHAYALRSRSAASVAAGDSLASTGFHCSLPASHSLIVGRTAKARSSASR